MTAFINPAFRAVNPGPSRSPSRRQICICSISRASTAGRRRLHASKLEDKEQLSQLPAPLLQEVRRLVRARSFLEAVRHTLQWQYTRFTNIIFIRDKITEDNDDGIPPSMHSLQRRVDYKFIDIPSGLLFRAAKHTNSTIDPQIKLCAVFEMYGVDFRDAQRRFDQAHQHTQQQIRAWTDVGLSLRTETDSGKEIYCEDLTDFLE